MPWLLLNIAESQVQGTLVEEQLVPVLRPHVLLGLEIRVPVSRTLLSGVIHVQVGNPSPSRTTATTWTVTSHSQLYPLEQHTNIFTDVCPCCLSQLIWGTTLSTSLQNCGIVPHRSLLACSKPIQVSVDLGKLQECKLSSWTILAKFTANYYYICLASLYKYY